jgi:hypothetical protein
VTAAVIGIPLLLTGLVVAVACSPAYGVGRLLDNGADINGHRKDNLLSFFLKLPTQIGAFFALGGAALTAHAMDIDDEKLEGTRENLKFS